MKIRRTCFAVLLSLLILLSAVGSVAATEHNSNAEYIRRILNYYRYHQEAAKNEIDCLIYALAETDLPLAQTWASIMEYWTYVNTDMTIYPEVLPDGLPKNDSLCIVVLGYELSADGSMKPELIGRLETALRSAEKYPNAYIACTGGGTARNNKTVTEADQMASWLMEQGIDPQRIIVENKSYSTVQNAIYTCKILAESYPNITHLALVTSDYHLPRSCLLFHTQAALASYKNNAPLLYVATNAAHPTGRSAESFEIQLSDLGQLTNVSLKGMTEPKLSTLECILVSGSARCVSGEELNLRVIAYYDTGLYRDVTKYVKYAGIDLNSVGMQEVTISYEEKGKTVSSDVIIEMLPAPTEPPTEPVTEPPTEAPTETTPTEEAVPAVETTPVTVNWLTVALIAGCLLSVAEVWIILRLRKIKKQQKAAEAERKARKLPDDDSPLEYI
jgi:vancomycin permeability regulator SanA